MKKKEIIKGINAALEAGFNLRECQETICNKDGCALSLAAIGLGLCDRRRAHYTTAGKRLGMTQEEIESFVKGFDLTGVMENTRAYKLGAEIRNKYEQEIVYA